MHPEEREHEIEKSFGGWGRGRGRVSGVAKKSDHIIVVTEMRENDSLLFHPETGNHT